jgi:DNA mismatch repair protein MutL
MSDIIKLLPDSVANQIAAGEVIQRPASVIKELVENAIDAHATSVQIVLKDAGRTLIQVIDDGTGMSDTDARLAFERHSTSKIARAEDLFTLHTMGFRGEALASIAAISQLELRTRRDGAQLGTKLVINASVCESQQPDVCPKGSNFMVKNIFFNVPARRKFLKSNQVELSNILKEFEKLALVNHNIDFTVSHNGNIMYKLMGSSFKQRITALWGHNLDDQLIPISVDTSLVKIDGFISRPASSRKRSFLQYLFVNGRYMRHPYFHKAIMSSYGELIPEDEQPNYFLNFSVDPETIDVNIHPTKTEIKFENEMPIWQILSAAVKESLGRFSAVPSIDFDTDGAPVIPAFNKDSHANVKQPEIAVDTHYNPFNAGGSGDYAKPNVTNWEELYNNFEKNKQDSIDSFVPDAVQPEQPALIDDASAVFVQINNRYIVSPAKSGLMVIDQHRAHLRVLYDRYMKQISGNNITSQSILFPVMLQLSPAQAAILNEVLPEMEKIGFNLSQLSGDDWSVNAVPSGLDGVDIKDIVLQVIDSIVSGGDSVSARVYEHIALTVAQSGAIPYGRILTAGEMESLVSDLMRLPEHSFTPGGKTIISVISYEQIDKLF